MSKRSPRPQGRSGSRTKPLTQTLEKRAVIFSPHLVRHRLSFKLLIVTIESSNSMRTGKGNDNNDRNDNKSTKAEIKWTEREQEKKVK